MEIERTFLIGILTKDEKVTEVLVAKFEGSENVTIIDAYVNQRIKQILS